MEKLKKIGYLFIAVIYLFLSTGVALVKTNCLCSDSTNISFYDLSDVGSDILSDSNCCEESLPSGENHEEKEHPSCGCDFPIVTYLKLTNHPGSESKIEYPVGKSIYIVYYPNEIILTLEDESTEAEIYPHFSPPDKLYGRMLISFLNQRKIALTA